MATIFGIISALILAVYTLVMVKKTGKIPYSLSATYYRLEQKKWFVGCMAVAGFTFMLSAMDKTPDGCQFLIFLTFLGMMLLALSPNFRDRKEAVLHCSGTAVVLLCTQAWVACTTPWLLLLWLLPVIYIFLYVGKHGPDAFIESKPVFWLEVTTYLTAYLNLFLL